MGIAYVHSRQKRLDLIHTEIDGLYKNLCEESPINSQPRLCSAAFSARAGNWWELDMESEQQAAQEAPLEAPKKVYEMLPEMLHRCSLHFEDGASCVPYHSELQMPDIMRLIQKDLSEPYSIYTYRYFIHNWPMLCFLAMYGDKCVGAIVCKLDMHKKVVRRGYIAMLAVDEKYRQKRIGSNLVMRAIAAMVKDGADEVVLETEITNEPALKLYENLGFVRDKRLFRYYLNGVDALRLKLWLR